MDVRVYRMRHPDTYAPIPTSRTKHRGGNVMIDGDRALFAQPGLVLVAYRDDRQDLYAGDVRHVLRRADNGLRIASKRIDLVNAAAARGIASEPF